MEKTIAIELPECEVKELLRWLKGLKGGAIDKLEKALEQLDAPQIGDRCAFWDCGKADYVLGKLTKNTNNRYECDSWIGWKNCAKIKKEAEF